MSHHFHSNSLGVASERPPQGQRAAAADPGLRVTAARSTFDWEPVELAPGKYTIGSEAGCDVVVPIEGVAPKHCTLLVGGKRHIVKAWSPLTWINDGAVSEATLRPGDRLILGPVEFRIDPGALKTQAVADSSPLPDPALDAWVALAKTQADAREQALRRREAQLQELLQTVQSCLDEAVDRDRASREQFLRERQTLQHRAAELSQQWNELEPLRRRATEQADEDSLRREELARWEQTLCGRHAELAARAAELARLSRTVKRQAADIQPALEHLETARLEVRTRQDVARTVLARQDAQFRQLNARQVDLEQREEALRDQLAEFRQQHERFQQQCRHLEEDQKHWTGKCRSRERLLDDMEQNFSARVEEIEREEARLSDWGQQLSSSAAVSAEASGESTPSSDLLPELQALQLQQAALQRDQQSLREREEDLRRREQEYADRREEQYRREAELAARSEELSAAVRDDAERGQDLASQLEQLQSRREELLALDGQLAARAEQLAAREADLAARIRELEERSAATADRSANDAVRGACEAELSAESAAARQDFAERQSRLEQEHIKLQQEQASLQAERDALAAAQALLAAERADLEALQSDVDQARLDLAAEREELNAQRQSLVAAQAELDGREQRLDKEWARLESFEHSLSEQRQEFEQRLADLEARTAAPPASPAEPPTAIVDDEVAPASTANASPFQNAAPRDETAAETALRRQAALSALFRRDDARSTPPVEEVSPAPVSSSGDDDKAIKLRNELASLFGLSSTPAPVREPAPAAEPVPEPVRVPEQPVFSNPSPLASSPAPAPKPEPMEEGEVTVESYMERLLARTRAQASGPGAAPAAAPAPAAASPPVPAPALPSAPLAEVRQPVSPEPEPPAKKVRKLNTEEKQSLRADIHSFRELANISARTAVAKSHVTRQSSTLRLMLAFCGVGWLLTLLALAGQPWLGEAQGTIVMSLFGVTAILTAFVLIRLREIRKIGKSSDALRSKDAATSEPEEPAPSTGKSGPLSFL